jgi:cytochrome c biogenesis protein CcmG, thiol:disulfide interchange protein DsbE
MSSRNEKERRRKRRLEEQGRSELARQARRVHWIGGGALGVLLVGGVVAIALASGTSDGGSTPTPSVAPPPGKGTPKQIAANLKEANEVIDTPLDEKLASLKGVPVVVNMWASWCPNCKQEFPFFQSLARKYKDRVAFLGLDSQDNRDAAESFLSEYPVIYPSVYDQSAEQARSIGAGQGWPTTVFIDASGQRTFVRQGGYTTEALLEQDLRTYGLGAAG